MKSLRPLLLPALVMFSLGLPTSGLAAIPALHPNLPELPAIYLEGRPLRLTCEHKENPLGLESTAPRLSWWMGDAHPGAHQSGYQIVVASSTKQLDGLPDVWDSGKVTSDRSVDVAYAGPALKSAQRCYWKIRTWDEQGRVSKWSASHWWEMGLLAPADWTAQWIGAPERDTSTSAPAVYLRQQFILKPDVRSARLYVSARGLFEMRLNGEKIGHDLFTPGWTDYLKRNQYLAYDLTDQVKRGVNVLGGILGDGWHNGQLLLIGGGKKNWYGQDTSLLAQLIVIYADGSREVIATDGSWQASTDGPIREADLYNGETYDARKELALDDKTWDAPGYEASAWLKARVVPAPPSAPMPKVNLPIRRHETVQVKSLKRDAAGGWILDFGQNLSGWVKFRLKGASGSMVTFHFAEMLNPDGSLHLANLRSAKSTDRYIFRGDGVETWEPRFTSHGFQYVGVTGLADAPPAGAIEAVVIHGDMTPTGYFETSNASVNQLQSNIWWSQRSNAFDVPTDCPQRDERLGWTGDANFFLPTSTFNYDVAAFIEKWMGDLRDAQGADGRFTAYAPAPDGVNDAPGYSDAGVICPWIIYQRYGDVRILEENYAAMKAWVDYQKKTSEGLLRPSGGYGDWLAPHGAGHIPTPKDLIATAYFFQVTDYFARIAKILKKTGDAREYRELAAAVGAAFRQKYVDTDGLPNVNTPTAYAMTLAFGLLPVESREKAAQHLVADLRSGQWKAATGFVGTPILMRALEQFKQDGAGYQLLMQREYPGWLYMIDQGANTIWERWNSWTPETGFGDKIKDTGVGDVSMNSFNHTVWGAVGEWMYSVIGGIATDASAPGFKKIKIRPRPGGDLTWAKAAYDSPYGRISTEWNLAGGTFSLDVTIPPNTAATVDLPDGKIIEVGAGQHAFKAKVSTPAQ
jgi:alpha-L-rhamnosidase